MNEKKIAVEASILVTGSYVRRFSLHFVSREPLHVNTRFVCNNYPIQNTSLMYLGSRRQSGILKTQDDFRCIHTLLDTKVERLNHSTTHINLAKPL